MPKVKKNNNLDKKAAFIEKQKRDNDKLFPSNNATFDQLNTSTNSTTSNVSLQSNSNQKTQKDHKTSPKQKMLNAQILMAKADKAKRDESEVKKLQEAEQIKKSQEAEEQRKKLQEETSDDVTNLILNLKQEQDNNTKQPNPSFWARMSANIANMFAVIWSYLVTIGTSIANIFHKGSTEKAQNNSHTSNNNEKILRNNKKHVNTWSECFNSMFFCFGATNAQNTNHEQDQKLGNAQSVEKHKRIKPKGPNTPRNRS